RGLPPLLGARSPPKRRSQVVLPLPFGPTSPTRKPAETMKFSRSNSVRSPSWQDTFSSSIRALVFCQVAELAIYVFEVDQALGLSIGRRKIDLRSCGAGSGIQVGEFAHQFASFI